MTYNPTCSRCWQPWTGLGSICNQCKIIEQQKLQVEQQQQALNQQQLPQQTQSQIASGNYNYPPFDPAQYMVFKQMMAEQPNNQILRDTFNKLYSEYAEGPRPLQNYPLPNDNNLGTFIFAIIFYGGFFWGLSKLFGIS